MSAAKISVIIALFAVILSLLTAGCEVIGNLATERESEKSIPAEFKLAETEGKIVVVVIMPGWIKTPTDLRVTLTDAFNLTLEEKVKIDKERLTEYSDIVKVRIALPEDKKDDAFEIAGKLDAKYVLVVQITDFDLSTFAEKDFYNGLMQTKSCLFDSNGVKLWPAEEENTRDITVGIEAEKGTVKTAVEKLSMATAHCVTRYFYNCNTTRFRIAEEQKKYDYYTW
jgi:hypothetical protein